MTLFQDIRYQKEQLKPRKIKEIIVTRKYAARGFVYLVEHQGLYLLVNANDYHIALSTLPGLTVDNINMSSLLMDIPVVEDETKALGVQASGVFQWCSKL